MAISRAASSQPDALGACASRELKPWPWQRTLAFVVVVCGAFWIGVGMAVALLVGAL